eukprot:scaffold597_cov176-Amphora_coffeaeformis.AAC.12
MASTLETNAWNTGEVVPVPAPAPSPTVFKKDKKNGNRQLRGITADADNDADADAHRELNISCDACMLLHNQYWICVVVLQCEGGMYRDRRSLLASSTIGSYTQEETKTFVVDPCWYNVPLETSKAFDTAVKSAIPDEFDASGIDTFLQYYDVACAVLKTTYGF